MAIDIEGNIVVPESRVIFTGQSEASPTALSENGENRLNFWRFKKNIVRVVLSKKTLKKTSTLNTGLGLQGFTSLDITNKSVGNFISYPAESTDGLRIVAYPLSKSNDVLGDGWPLSPPMPPRSNANDGRATANGRLVYWIEQSSINVHIVNLFVQQLSPSGQPVLNPVYIDHILGHTSYLSTIGSADATRKLPDNKRFLVYTKQGPFQPNWLMSQRIDATTGA